MKYERRLGHSEIKWQYVYVDCEHREFFPEPNKMFALRVGEREISVFIDSKQRIRTTLFRGFLDLREGDIVVFDRQPDGTWSIGKRIQHTPEGVPSEQV